MGTMRCGTRRHRLLGASLMALTGAVSVTLAAQPGEVIAAQQEVDRAAAASQHRIDGMRDEAREAANRYAQALAEAESFERYNDQLAAQLKSQEAEMASIENQLADIEVTNREVQPLMKQMSDALREFVSLDVPFLLDERMRRVDNLQSMIDRADVSISEKYRRILEAYQIELEYGRTLEAYEGLLRQGDEARTVEFVRLGRVSLMYRTPDGNETGYWDAAQRKWVVADEYAHDIQEAIRIAKKQGAPDLLTVPVPAAREVRT